MYFVLGLHMRFHTIYVLYYVIVIKYNNNECILFKMHFKEDFYIEPLE